MRPRHFFCLALPIALLAACAVPPQATPPVTGTCNAEAASGHVGQTVDEALAERLRIASGSRSKRVLGPGDAATMDYRMDRLNILVDASRRLVELRCG